MPSASSWTNCPCYWVHALNQVPWPKVLVLDDLTKHLGIIPDGLPVVLLKCFVLDKSPG